MQSETNVDKLIEKMAKDLDAKLQAFPADQVFMIGIHTGGVWIAEKLHQILKLPLPLGSMDISFYRDDFSRIGMNPQVKPSELPESVDDKHIVLVDDILHTGRTIRAAMNEIFDYGRPASVTLAVLGVRSGRELPIQADVAGTELDLKDDEHVKLSGPEKLKLTVVKVVS
ncbi:bifunctional pyr operon transcriptional regulator/uracil phosphoribosyltransferase PyrR [Kaarinaea lacus]